MRSTHGTFGLFRAVHGSNGREKCCAGERLVPELPLQESELGMLALAQLCSERLAKEDSVSSNDRTNPSAIRGQAR
jgi:hypothetical protein